MLRSLEKERYLLKLGCKARSELTEPFLNVDEEFRQVKIENIGSDGSIGAMQFEEGDVFCKLHRYFRFQYIHILSFTYNTSETCEQSLL